MKRRAPWMLLLVVAGWASAALGSTSPAAAQSSCLDYLYDINLYLQCPAGPSITVPPAIDPGGPVPVEAAGWLAGSTLAIAFECGGVPVPAGTVAIGPDTTGRADIPVPAGCLSLRCGAAVVSGTGQNMIGTTVTVEVPTTVSGCASTSTTIPRVALPLTGSESGRLVTVGSALVVIGAAALYGSVRARTGRN